MFKPTSGKYGSGSAANPSPFPSPWPPSSGNWSQPAPDTPPSATQERPNGSSPADGPADPSAEPTSLTVSANWGSPRARLARPRCSASPPNCPPPCSRDCSASTSTSQSPGNAPPPETGRPTQPTTAVANTARTRPPTALTAYLPDRHSESCNIPLRQSGSPTRACGGAGKRGLSRIGTVSHV